MIRERVRPTSDKLVIDIPDEYINKEVEILIFADSEAKKRKKMDETKKLLEEFKKISKNPIKIDSHINITKLDEDINDDIF